MLRTASAFHFRCRSILRSASLKPEPLLVGDERIDIVPSQEFEGGHDRFGPREPGVREVGEVPVVGVLAPLLGKVRPCPLGAEEVGLVRHVIARSRDPLRAVAPVDVPDELRMAERASVGDIESVSPSPRAGSGAGKSSDGFSVMVAQGRTTEMKRTAPKTMRPP